MRILLINPPVYDFSAYDFWLKPYGLLRIGGMLRGRADLHLFDFLDRRHPWAQAQNLRETPDGRGAFPSEEAPKPEVFRDIRRRFHRFGLPAKLFQNFLDSQPPFDFALVQTGMTYWYSGVAEIIQQLRQRSSGTRIVLGGVYATLCNEHARELGADLVVKGNDLNPLWNMLGVQPNYAAPPLWEGYPELTTGVIKLTKGCPCRCTYCAVPAMDGSFSARQVESVLAEFEHLTACGARQIAFYDDALLHQANDVLAPFLRAVHERSCDVSFHTPNAMHARLVTRDLARLMVKAGFRSFYLGFESFSSSWQNETGGKVTSDDLARAVEHLTSAGADPTAITAHMIIGHPETEAQQIDETMECIHRLGIRISLSEFSPVPGTVDGEACRVFADISEPLWHNKIAFTIARLGEDEVNRLKLRYKELNRGTGTEGI